jgi:N utilization substance protein B
MITTPAPEPITINEINELASEQDSLKPTTQRSLRSLAFHILYSADRNNYDQPLSFVLDDFREGFEVNFADDCFAVVMVRGVLEHQKEIDAKILPLLQNWSFERLGCCTVLILRMAFWELIWTKTPPQVAINEAVELAKAFAENDAHKFINGVLDSYCEQTGIKRESPADNNTSKDPEIDCNDLLAD